MYQVGQIFQSPRALVRCHSTPIATPDGHGGHVAGVDTRALTPNPYSAKTDRVTGRLPVWVGDECIGRVDCVNTDENRQNSLWRLTRVDTQGAGHGNCHHISGAELTWARYDCQAMRIHPDGTPHESGETVSFQSAGSRCIVDLTFIRQAQRA